MKVRFYNFSKRSKETMFPTTGYAEVNLTLKDSCDVEHPTFLIQSFNAAAYNYFYIPDWNRYYFISAANSTDNMWEVAGTEDYLGSFKAEIGNTVCNILYASGSTKDIPETRIPVKSTLRKNKSDLDIGLTLSYANMRYILGITGKGSFGCYILENNSKLSELLDGIDSWSSFITDNWTFTKQLFFGGSASECMRSALGIPIPFNKADHGSIEDLNLGNYPCMDGNDNPIKGYKITDPILDYGGNITIPWIYNDWRNISNMTSVCVYIPLIGLISLPSTELKNELNLSIEYKVNITSGDVAGIIKGATSNKIYSTFSGNCAMPIAFGSTGIDTNKVTQAAVTGLGTLIAVNAATGGAGSIAAIMEGIENGALMGNAVVGAGMASTAFNIMQALGGTADGSAGLGGGAVCALDDKVHCFVISKELTDTQANLDPIMGKPYMGKAKPSDFSGYVQTDGFQFKSPRAYLSEIQKINQLMDSGIYYT